MLLINIYFSVVMLNQAHTILLENNHKLIVVCVTIYGRGFEFILIILLLVGFYIQKSYVRFSYTFDRLDF